MTTTLTTGPAGPAGPTGPNPQPDDLGAVRLTAVFPAPARFDVHTVETLEAWIADQRAAGARRLLVDCGDVRFLDVAVAEAIDTACAAAARADELEVINLSVAAAITFELLAAASLRSTKVAA